MTNTATENQYTADLVAFGIREALEESEPHSGLLTDEVVRMEEFEDAGVLTSDYGFVVTMRDGTEFQVTIVRSK